MIKLLLVAVAALTVSPLRAQSFEDATGAAIKPFISEDAFTGVAECGVLDIKTIRAFTLEEAQDLVKPCVAAAARNEAFSAKTEAGFISAPQSGQPGKAGLLIKTDLVPGSKAHRDMVLALSRRDGRLLGHPARLLVKSETAPAAVSTLQKAIDNCMLLTVVRDIRSGDDFVKVYGKCLTRDSSLKISDVRPAEGLAVTIKTSADAQAVEAYNGFLTVNAGKGPVQVMVVAYGAQVALP